MIFLGVYLGVVYMLGFRAFAMGEERSFSWFGLILFLLSPLTIPLIFLLLVARLVADFITEIPWW